MKHTPRAACTDASNSPLADNCLLASGRALYLPAAFPESVGISPAGAEQTDHYGIPYVYASDLIEKAGKTITLCSNGLVVLADSGITDETILTTLYRSLQ